MFKTSRFLPQQIKSMFQDMQTFSSTNLVGKKSGKILSKQKGRTGGVLFVFNLSKLLFDFFCFQFSAARVAVVNDIISFARRKCKREIVFC